ncbi:MAG: hypothetical protein IJP82_00465 [Bacteroidaceae bacterium]|nr:hypothetical protein [Bacteroidaceae bacterium]
MDIMKKILYFVLVAVLMAACASMKAPVINQIESLDGYKYVYITPTSELTSGSSGVYGGKYGVYGSGSTKTINPSDVISGIMLKQGYIRLPELNPELLDQTLIVNYGESGRRNVNLGYSIEVTIQFLSAKTNMPVCICTAEGQGSTEADDIRIAINRALAPLFKGNNK